MPGLFGGLRSGEGEAQWRDWRWQVSNRLRSLDDIAGLLGLEAREVSRYRRLVGTFRYAVTPYYLSLIDWSDPDDPVRKQCIPDPLETEFRMVGDADPLEEEEDSQAPGLVHRYPDRVLAVVTNRCAVYCRHCTRKRNWHEGEWTKTKDELGAMVRYVRSAPSVREVVVSGGDPLMMKIELLDWFLGELRLIPHVEVLRVGTRVPVVVPMMMTQELAQMLKGHRPLWLNTQFNCPQEVTPEAQEAVERLLLAGIPVSNQSVLLKGVNDSVEVMKGLCHSLQRIMVRPYYLFQCDPVTGVEHFRTSIWKGMEIIEKMRGHTSGLSVPSFVVDAPGGGGKVPLQPFYLLSVSEEDVVLRNYEGMFIRYHNPGGGRTNGGNGKTSNAGAPVQGEKSKRPPVPEDSPRYKRRRRKECLVSISGDVR